MTTGKTLDVLRAELAAAIAGVVHNDERCSAERLQIDCDFCAPLIKAVVPILEARDEEWRRAIREAGASGAARRWRARGLPL